MIILRYLGREVFHTLLIMISVLLFITVSNMFVHYFAIAASGAMLTNAVFQLIGMTLPRYIALLLPISFFISIIFAYGRMFADNELWVMFACGMSWRRLLFITILPAIVVAIIVGSLSIFVIPKMSSHLDVLSHTASAKNNLSLIKPGRFVSIAGGNEIVYIGKSSIKKQQVANLFMYRKMRNGLTQIITAPKAVQKLDPKTAKAYIVLENGHQYRGKPFLQNFQLVNFKTYTAHLKGPGDLKQIKKSIGAMSTKELALKAGYPEKAELQWRISLPIAVLVLTFLALAICRVNPRSSRYAKLIPSVLVFIVYFNLLTVSKSWLASGTISPILGLWWVHVVFLLLAIGYLWFGLEKPVRLCGN